MSNVSAVAIFIVVLSPLLIPLIITGVHAIAKWRRSLRSALKNTGPKSRAVTSTDGEDLTPLADTWPPRSRGTSRVTI